MKLHMLKMYPIKQNRFKGFGDTSITTLPSCLDSTSRDGVDGEEKTPSLKEHRNSEAVISGDTMRQEEKKNTPVDTETALRPDASHVNSCNDGTET